MMGQKSFSKVILELFFLPDGVGDQTTLSTFIFGLADFHYQHQHSSNNSSQAAPQSANQNMKIGIKVETVTRARASLLETVSREKASG